MTSAQKRALKEKGIDVKSFIEEEIKMRTAKKLDRSKIKSYIVKKGTLIRIIRFNDIEDMDLGVHEIGNWVSQQEFGFERSFLIATKTCVCCNEVSYVFNHKIKGTVEIKEKDLILTPYTIKQFYKRKTEK